MRPLPAQELCKRFCVRFAVVFAFHHGVFIGHAASGLLKEIPARLHELLQRIPPVDRHDRAAPFVGGVMERNGKCQTCFPVGKRPDARHDAAGRNCHMPQAHPAPLRGGKQLQKPHDIVEIVHRLADAHEHQPGNFHARIALCLRDLEEHFGREKIPDIARNGRCAERAAHLAAHLRGDAEPPAVVVVHEHRFHMLTVGESI